MKKYSIFIIQFVVLVLMVPTIVAQSNQNTRFIFESGAIIRGDTTIKDLALVFTGDEFGDGADFISAVLSEKKIKASFFLTGNFYRNPDFIIISINCLQNHILMLAKKAPPLNCE